MTAAEQRDDAGSDLVFVKWYGKTAVYRGGRLLLYESDMPTCRPLLMALGFACHGRPEVETHNIAPEWDRDANGHWLPPVLLADFDRIAGVVGERKRGERIRQLEVELRRLKAGEPT